MQVVTLGEAMIRLTPPNFGRIETSTTFKVSVAGSELNTAVALSRLGIRSAWISKLPESQTGNLVLNSARAHGVDTSFVIRCADGRVGILYLEEGASPRPSQVLYDRQGSTINFLRFEEVDWDKVFGEAEFFHISGINFGLSDTLRETCLKAIEKAKSMGVRVSFDLNYRKNLWSEEEARRTVSSFLSEVDIFISTIDDVEAVFGIEGESEEVGREVRKRFRIDTVVLTLREAPTVRHGFWSSLVITEGGTRRGRRIELELIDRVGSGDAFNAGFLFGLLKGSIEVAQDWGDALSALKHSIPFDYAILTEKEVERFLKEGGTKIRR